MRKPNHLVNEKTHWWIFEIIGLKIEDQPNWLQFMFDDSTIVNGRQLSKYFIENNFPDDILFYYPPDIPNKTFLIVSSYGTISNEKEKKIEITSRAREIMGFIYFVFFFLSNFKTSICFHSQVFSNNSMQTILIKGNHYRSAFMENTAGEYPIRIQTPPFEYTRENLIGLFENPYFKWICEALKRKDKSICKFLMVFYVNTNTLSPIIQQIGSITSIEVLLKTEGKYENIEKRLSILLGEKVYNSFISDSNQGIFHKRHQFIHEGEDVDSNDAFRAIKIASLALINYSYLWSNHNSKFSICKYLDLLNYLKHDKDIKEYDFNQARHFANLEILLPKMDWIIQAIISNNQICSVDKNHNIQMKIVETIVLYSILRKIPIDVSYKIIVNNIYFNRGSIPKYSDFQNIYVNELEGIQARIDLHLKYNHYEINE